MMTYNPKYPAHNLDIIEQNRKLVTVAQETGKQISAALLTRKPALSFKHPDTAAIYSPLLKLVTLPLGFSYHEFGTTVHTVRSDNGEPVINDDFKSLFAILREFESILMEHVIFDNGTQIYQLEPGNKFYTAVQLIGGNPMPRDQKEEK